MPTVSINSVAGELSSTDVSAAVDGAEVTEAGEDVSSEPSGDLLQDVKAAAEGTGAKAVPEGRSVIESRALAVGQAASAALRRQGGRLSAEELAPLAIRMSDFEARAVAQQTLAAKFHPSPYRRVARIQTPSMPPRLNFAVM